MNHRYEVDWLIGWIFCERIGLLGVSVFFLITKIYTPMGMINELPSVRVLQLCQF